ncbi:MAG: hypothetical protein WAU88_08790 [Candidatus Zixiibacteriota bacterium]
MATFELWIAALFTLAIFSFLYKDNPMYRMAEHIFAGISVGYYIGLYWDTVIVQQLWMPLTEGQEASRFWLIVPGVMGLLMFTRLSNKWSWLSRIGLAFIMGNTAGVFLLSELHGKVLAQMSATMQTQVTAGAPNYLLTAIVVLGVISTLIYFYFSKEHKGVLGVTARIGIWFIMISFGAHFGYTVMGRISLLIGRVYFLYHDWMPTFLNIF